jgi:hypothetical protein
MNRREMMQLLAASSVGAKIEFVEPEPVPLMIVIKLPYGADYNSISNMEEVGKAIAERTGVPVPIVYTIGDCSIEVKIDPRAAKG